MIHVEPWPTTASGPYLIDAETDEDEDAGHCQVVEGDGELRLLEPPVADAFSQQRVAFVDGVRRADARLYMSGDRFAHGVAGAHGTGAVLCNPSTRPEFHECHVRRLVMWGSGVHERLPDQPGGWALLPVAGITPNLTVLAAKEAVIGAEHAEWAGADIPGVFEGGSLLLGDFTRLAAFLARQRAPVSGLVDDDA